MVELSIIKSRSEPSGWRFEAGERDVGTCSGDDAVARVVPGKGVVACLETHHDLKADS